MERTKIREVYFLEDFRMQLLMEDGQSIAYDLKPKLMTARFRELADWGIFSQGMLKNGRVIIWSTGAELSLYEIKNSQKGRDK